MLVLWKQVMSDRQKTGINSKALMEVKAERVWEAQKFRKVWPKKETCCFRGLKKLFYTIIDETRKKSKTKMLLEKDFLRPDTDITDKDGQYPYVKDLKEDLEEGIDSM